MNIATNYSVDKKITKHFKNMTTKRSLLFFLWFLILSLNLQAEMSEDPFNDRLPSQQTEQELQNLNKDLTVSAPPSLRARPTDIGDYDQAQKIPLGDFGWNELIGLLVILFIYVIHKRKRQLRTHSKTFLILIPILMAGVANAQNPAIKAVNDNYYLKPGGIYTLNITINDIPGDCANNSDNLEVTINNTPALSGVTWSVITSNKIRVLVPAAARGSDIIEYTIKCPRNAATSSAKAYLSFSERPDFVDDATCTIDPPETVWDIKKAFRSNEPVFYLAAPLAGDLDGDNKPEIVAFGVEETNIDNVPSSIDIVVFDNQLKCKNIFEIKDANGTVVGTDNYFGNPMALGDVDGDGRGEILVGTGYRDNFKLRCYTETGTLKWTSHNSSGSEVSCFAYPIAHPKNTGSPTPVISDIDGDGLVEIFIGDRFFDGKTGLLLATIPQGQVTTPTPLHPNLPTSYIWGRGFRQQGDHVGNGTYQPVIADINNDGRLDAVCGNATYDIKINRSNPSLSTTSLIAAVALPDGLTSVADINGDGILDVVVITWSDPNFIDFTHQYTPNDMLIPTTMYVWDGATNKVYGIVQPKAKDGKSPGIYGSRAFIGDIDGDNKPEICFTYANMMAAYKYNGTTLVPLWSGKGTSDGSGATTMTMFDFNLDGEVELVYRDETHIRILDKNGNNVKDKSGVDAVFNCYSGTHTEYPIIVDLDGDGHTEIIVSGREGPYTTIPTYLMAFTSKTPKKWAPARQVWNQHGYNPLWVNKDLSIPRYQTMPTNVSGFIDGSTHTPFNSFLQQAGWLNIEGKPFNKAPDLAFQFSKNQRLSYNEVTDQMTIKAFLTNIGSEIFTGDILLSLYSYTEAGSSYFHIHSTVHTSETISIYGELELDLTIPNWSSVPFPAYDNFVLTLNLTNDAPNAPKPFYKNQEECLSWNNRTDKISYISGSVVMCQGDQALLSISPSNTYDCYWYSADGQPYPSAASQIADSRVIFKQTSDTEYYLIDIYKKGTSDKISTAPDTLFVYQSADTLVWEGKINKDWHNPNNWFNPNDPQNLERYKNIPGRCTNVLIPSNNQVGIQIDQYPNLDPAETNLTVYSASRCNNVHFDHGGEIEKVSDLTYSRAYVKLDIESNRWYCFAPPLRNFYSGDIYKTSGNPFDDGIFVFERLFSQPHPNWGGSYLEGTWGNTFSNPAHRYLAGHGVGVWIDDLNPDANSRMGQNFSFPKADTFYNYYNADGTFLTGPIPIPDRKYSHRFIFEESIDTTTKNVELEVEATSGGNGNEILIGNPFMAHLDFDSFYSANSSKIEPYYRVIDSDGNYATYRIGGGSTGTPVLTAGIAPMQSVLVTPKTPITSANFLIANGSMTTQIPGNKLRNIQKNEVAFLRMFISDTELSNRTSLIIDPSSKTTTAFSNSHDVLKTIKIGAISRPSIYLLSADKKYTDIKKVAKLEDMSFDVGFCTDLKGPLAIGFEFDDIRELASFYDVLLVDKYKGKKVLMSQYQNIYCFEKEDTNRFTNDRFELRFAKAGSSLEDNNISDNTGVLCKTIDNTLFVMTKNDKPISRVLIYDIRGRLVYTKTPNSSTFSTSLPSGIFVVRTSTDTDIDTQKITIK